MVVHVIVFGTILAIPRHTKWYYDACKICNKQVTEIVTHKPTVDGDGEIEKKVYECTRCKQHHLEAVKRYKILINVQDSTGVVSLVLWDWEANKILKKSAKALYDEILNGDADMDLFPVDLPSEDTVSFKDMDVLSITVDSATPLSHHETSKGNSLIGSQKSGSLISTNAYLKRNLVEIYDDDEVPGHSATKARPTTMGIDKPHGKHHLLTPKFAV
ncbi:hypothetical protein L1987_45793 [Smallanthus sonchifolius]|uniref:Uncharacterized protein n=1 Tax=Smallanthus sonchifolius TaxID=185202 RepID=A0ACB9FXT9_9ASTR|nr:hypothetical protein L1987_45793 [Smallanthus sonchifolius]